VSDTVQAVVGGRAATPGLIAQGRAEPVIHTARGPLPPRFAMTHVVQVPPRMTSTPETVIRPRAVTVITDRITRPNIHRAVTPTLQHITLTDPILIPGRMRHAEITVRGIKPSAAILLHTLLIALSDERLTVLSAPELVADTLVHVVPVGVVDTLDAVACRRAVAGCAAGVAWAIPLRTVNPGPERVTYTDLPLIKQGVHNTSGAVRRQRANTCLAFLLARADIGITGIPRPVLLTLTPVPSRFHGVLYTACAVGWVGPATGQAAVGAVVVVGLAVSARPPGLADTASVGV
jgi:hypothetical protein